jgi:hypothetical protein
MKRIFAFVGHSALFALALFVMKPVSASECTEADQLKTSNDFVKSRFCGSSFEDLDVDYLGSAGELMKMLRDPVVSGHFIVDWDALVLAKNLSFHSSTKNPDGSLTARYTYHRLGANEGGVDSGADVFRVFVRDENPTDSFEITISKRCRVVNPPLARVHPARLHSELESVYLNLQSGLAEKCEDLGHCKVRRLQVESLKEQWPKEIKENCSFEISGESVAK